MTSYRQTLPPIDQLALFSVELDRQRRGTKPPSIKKARGRHREHPRDVLNEILLEGLTLVRPYDIPRIEACRDVPEKLIAFSEAMTHPDHEAWVHFYEDDYRYSRLQSQPEAYLSILSRFAGVISPDFSTYRNLPEAVRIYRVYLNQLIGARLQAGGIKVIANVRLSGVASVPWALAGAPRNSSIAVGLHGCIRDRANRHHVVKELEILCAGLSPTSLIVYGSPAYGVLDVPRELGIPVHVYKPDTFNRSSARRAVA